MVGCRCVSRSAHPATNIIKITTWQLQHSLRSNMVIDVDQATHSNLVRLKSQWGGTGTNERYPTSVVATLSPSGVSYVIHTHQPDSIASLLAFLCPDIPPIDDTEIPSTSVADP